MKAVRQRELHSPPQKEHVERIADGAREGATGEDVGP